MADDSGDGLRAGPNLDPLELAVAQARVEAAMFGNAERVALGRYQLSEKLGAGGMGVVWGAWDPELERHVAIKLVQAGTDGTRILGEGQALAKLSHPNVVAVHDVGTIGDQIYVVMEWVRGKTLRAACEGRDRRAVLRIYREAGAGLAAVHAAGLVHRDFKPENAIVGDDGRVRILDFGLATTAGGSGAAGTPRYMAPEQERGAATPASDQYAFCAALREALGKLPPWIAAIVDRGQARDPEARFASMAELLRALDRDPARVWRRGGIAIGVLAIAGVAFVLGRSGSAGVEPCGGGAAEIAALDRGVLAHVEALGVYGAGEARRLAPALEAYRDRWTRAHHAACMAHERRELTDAHYERSMRCLERSRASYRSALDVLAAVPAARLADAAVAVQALPDAERCVSDARLSTVVPPPAAIAADVTRIEHAIDAARIRAIAADPDAAKVLATLSADAERLGYTPLVAKARLAYGFALGHGGDTAAAIMPLDRAISAAIEANDDVTAVEAYARLVWATAVSTSADSATPEEALATLPIIERIARRLGPSGGFVGPLLLNNVGIAYMAKPDEAEAARWFTRAREAWERSKDPGLELAYIPSNLALTVTDRAQQRALLDETAARFTATLGPDHPFALEFRTRAAMFVQHPGEAARAIEEGCAKMRALHPHLAMQIYFCTYEVGWLAVERGDDAAARAAFTAILATPGDDNYHALARIHLAMLDGDPHAQRDAAALGDTLAKSTAWWLRVYAADAFLVAGNLDRARDLLDDTSAGHAQVYYQRRIARVRYLRARAHHDREAAAAAAAWYREAGGYERALAELDAITGSR
jgi:serine/threonine protein kinase